MQQHKAQAYSIIITYTIETALKYYQLDSSLVLSVTIRNNEEFERWMQSGIPASNVVAFVGITEPDSTLYQILHQKGISCILGTMGNLDRSAAARNSNVYAQLVKNGADILATDRPAAAAEAIQELKPTGSLKKKFYKNK